MRRSVDGAAGDRQRTRVPAIEGQPVRDDDASVRSRRSVGARRRRHRPGASRRPRAPPVYSPEKVAKAILRSAVRPRHTVVVGGAGKAELVFQRVSPKAMDVFSRITAFRLQKSKDPKGPRDGDALDNPVEGDDRVHGVVTTTHR